jgi:alpha-glucoside transport system substrate-binding protein
MVLSACGSSKKAATSSTTAASSGSSTTAAAGGSSTKAASSGSTAASSGSTVAAGSLKGKTIKILGPETGAEADGVTEAFKPFEDATGAKIEYTGSRDAETQARTAAEAGGSAVPDIFFAPQPGLVKDLAPKLKALPDSVVTAMKADYDPYWTTLGTVAGKVYGIPVKSDLKSLVWYSPSLFKSKGYAIPTTWDEMVALADKMKADGIAPFCVGIESGDATGWPFTDWMEDVMLRLKGPDVYDQWVNHKIPFNDPQVQDVAKFVLDLWSKPGYVENGTTSIVSTGFANAGLDVLNGKCGMHRQANFYGAQFKTAKADVKFGPEGDVNVFYLPTISDKFGKVTLIAGVLAVAFTDKPETQAALAYLESADYANNRAKAGKGGFLSPNQKSDPKLFPDVLDQQLASILVKASPVRFDGSDQMPTDANKAFWKDGSAYVAGTEDLKTFTGNVEAAWPKS